MTDLSTAIKTLTDGSLRLVEMACSWMMDYSMLGPGVRDCLSELWQGTLDEGRMRGIDWYAACDEFDPQLVSPILPVGFTSALSENQLLVLRAALETVEEPNVCPTCAAPAASARRWIEQIMDCRGIVDRSDAYELGLA